MKKAASLLALAAGLSGCYGYNTTRTITAQGKKECAFEVRKVGNSVIGYDEHDFSNAERSEKECREWLK